MAYIWAWDVLSMFTPGNQEIYNLAAPVTAGPTAERWSILFGSPLTRDDGEGRARLLTARLDSKAPPHVVGPAGAQALVDGFRGTYDPLSNSIEGDLTNRNQSVCSLKLMEMRVLQRPVARADPFVALDFTARPGHRLFSRNTHPDYNNVSLDQWRVVIIYQGEDHHRYLLRFVPMPTKMAAEGVYHESFDLFSEYPL